MPVGDTTAVQLGLRRTFVVMGPGSRSLRSLVRDDKNITALADSIFKQPRQVVEIVIPAKAGIQYAAGARLIISASGILDHPLSRMMTRSALLTSPRLRGEVAFDAVIASAS